MHQYAVSKQLIKQIPKRKCGDAGALGLKQSYVYSSCNSFSWVEDLKITFHKMKHTKGNSGFFFSCMY